MEWLWLALICVSATAIDWFVVHGGMATGWYILVGWFLVWLICVFVFRSSRWSFRSKRGIWSILKSCAIAIPVVFVKSFYSQSATLCHVLTNQAFLTVDCTFVILGEGTNGALG